MSVVCLLLSSRHELKEWELNFLPELGTLCISVGTVEFLSFPQRKGGRRRPCAFMSVSEWVS